MVTAEPLYGGAPVAVSVLKRGGCRVVQKNTRAVDGTESGGATQLAEVFEGWKQRLGPLETRVACAGAHRNRAPLRGARQHQVEDVGF
jgi:hypothetical protein